MNDEIERICRALRVARLPTADEKRTQASVAAMLATAGLGFERERKLSGRDVIDFLVSGRIGVEVKLKESKRAIYRQCERYCAHECIEALVLVSNTAMGLPGEIGGKPVYVVSIGRGWL